MSAEEFGVEVIFIKPCLHLRPMRKSLGRKSFHQVMSAFTPDEKESGDEVIFIKPCLHSFPMKMSVGSESFLSCSVRIYARQGVWG